MASGGAPWATVREVAGSSPAPASSSPAPAPSGSLYEQYASSSSRPGSSPGRSSRSRGLIVGDTKSSVLRKERVRLNVYLNQEGVGVPIIGGPQGHGTIVMLPLECDTLEEVMPLIQLKLDLDKRMLYAAELWLPDGTYVTTYQELVDAAALSTPIIVGCGEPFDGSRVPMDLLEFHKQGGGRHAVHKVNSSLAFSRKNHKVERAENVREAGHGLLPNSLAVVTARTQNVEANREKAASMRQQYMESLQRRSAEVEGYKFSVRQNIQFHRMEKEESRMRQEEKAQQRLENLREMRRRDELDVMQSKREDEEKARMQHDRVKRGEEAYKKKKKATNDKYRKDARKADFGTRPGEEASAFVGTY